MKPDLLEAEVEVEVEIPDLRFVIPKVHAFLGLNSNSDDSDLG